MSKYMEVVSELMSWSSYYHALMTCRICLLDDHVKLWTSDSITLRYGIISLEDPTMPNILAIITSVVCSCPSRNWDQVCECKSFHSGNIVVHSKMLYSNCFEHYVMLSYFLQVFLLSSHPIPLIATNQYRYHDLIVVGWELLAYQP